MKRTAVLFSVILCIFLVSYGSAETFFLRNGITYGDSMEEVEAKESLGISEKTDSTLKTVEGTIAVREFGEDVYKPIKFSYGAAEHEVSVAWNGKTGLDDGFTDMNGNEFKFSRFTKTPFKFRDFHDVRVGLTKI